LGRAFGSAVALNQDGSILAVGAPASYVKGVADDFVSVFQLVQGNWNQMGQSIFGGSAGSLFGSTLSLSSDGLILAVGEPLDDTVGLDAGKVSVLSWSGIEWVQVGEDIHGQHSGDNFGYSVSLSDDGTFLGVGAPYNDDNGEDAGNVRLFEWTGASWQQLAHVPVGSAAGDLLGYSVSLSADGSTLAVGAPDIEVGQSGYVKILRISEDRLGLIEKITGDYQQLGYSVSLNSDGSVVAIAEEATTVRIFQEAENQWFQRGENLNFSGYMTVSLDGSGDYLAVGCTTNDPFGRGSLAESFIWNGQSWTKIGDRIHRFGASFGNGPQVCISKDGSMIAVGSPLSFLSNESVRTFTAFPFTLFPNLCECVSSTTESFEIDASIINPSKDKYVWYFKPVESDFFPIPDGLNGLKLNFACNEVSNGTWRVEITNEVGTKTYDYKFRVFQDSDLDGISDLLETDFYKTDIYSSDSDGDTLSDYEEIVNWESDPLLFDSNGDGFDDGFVVRNGYSPEQDFGFLASYFEASFAEIKFRLSSIEGDRERLFLKVKTLPTEGGIDSAGLHEFNIDMGNPSNSPKIFFRIKNP
jgi:hypothetical protein